MKILIVEDEPLAGRDLENMVRRLEPKAEIISSIRSVEVARQWFANNVPPDLIMSDIQLADGISFEVYEQLHIHCPIIFTTAYDDYAIRAFKLNSIDYLLKPIDIKELEAALFKFKSLTSHDTVAEQLKNIMSQWGQTAKKYKERFLSLQRNTLVPVTQQDIAYFYKEELIFIKTISNEKLISEHQTLDELEGLLNPEVFFRVNRQHIIHIQSVGRIKNTHKGITVQLKAPFNVDLDISREKVTAFKKWIG
jgi:DNA-binding LytR/AlgR family response regulator